ncbi:hypothetical protein [Caloranaerobacter ferrireducens]|uniref:hypothetical protein n=1 Tax=Caloranaerobacter ferrireducens TaxID=1323370 RepID=UPI00084D7B32|nr:hypothetical protein [Caloranaerobacter ferrireducens]
MRSIYDEIYDKTKDSLEELMDILKDLSEEIQVSSYINNKTSIYKPKIKKFRLNNRPRHYRARSNLR